MTIASQVEAIRQRSFGCRIGCTCVSTLGIDTKMLSVKDAYYRVKNSYHTRYKVIDPQATNYWGHQSSAQSFRRFGEAVISLADG